MVNIRPLREAPFGVEALDVDIAGGIERAAQKQLVDALYEHRVLIIRDQTLNRDEYLAFGRQWGRPIPHVLDHLRMPGYPEMMAVGNTEAKDSADSVRNGAAFWHTDQSYEAEPAMLTMLHAIEVPESGGETMIVDLKGAYDALDKETRAELEGLRAKHFYGAASGRDGEKIAAPIINRDQEDQVPPVEHAIARPHPVTGRITLYGLAGTPYEVIGMDETDGLALLARLKAHALEDRFIYKHRYQVGDIAIWDTNQTLHSGVPIETATAAADSRLLWRISLRGRPAVYA